MLSTENFIYRAVEKNKRSWTSDRKIITRFPPEPNGHLHIGSAYAIHISWSIAKLMNGAFNLRYDDTNPNKESWDYVHAIEEDMAWLGFDWEGDLRFGSDYFDYTLDCAKLLIDKGLAYVDFTSAKDMAAMRGTLTEPGKASVYRNHTPDQVHADFNRMISGDLKPGDAVLRAKIDLTSPNVNMRDPVLYRMIHTPHYRTGDEWRVYPMYDFAHPIQDAVEGVSHSLCSIEFLNHRPLYDWVVKHCELDPVPVQREFGRMTIKGVITSKRYLREMVEDHLVKGWDDPRLPTIKGMRRKGYTASSIHSFLGEIGVAKQHASVDIDMLDHFYRNEMRDSAMRLMAVKNPIKVTLTNMADDHVEWLSEDLHPDHPEWGKRSYPFSKVLYIDRADFSENPPPKFKRLTRDNEIRLRKAYFIRVEDLVRDESGQVVELLCTYDPETKSGSDFNSRKPAGTIHWVSDHGAVPIEFRMYNRLIMDDNAKISAEVGWKDTLNPDALEVVNGVGEPHFANLSVETRMQLIREGYFIVDQDSTKDHLVLNRTVPLKSGKGK